MQPSFNIL